MTVRCRIADIPQLAGEEAFSAGAAILIRPAPGELLVAEVADRIRMVGRVAKVVALQISMGAHDRVAIRGLLETKPFALQGHVECEGLGQVVERAGQV